MERTLSVIFFGTHEFASTILKGMIDCPTIKIESVITQPDRPVGRKHEISPSFVKRLALSHGMPVLEPETLKNCDSLPSLADFFVVAQYGKLIPKQIIAMPKFGTINVHTSLLPRYRGATPIQSAILHGNTSTGITIMLMDGGLDTGPILSQKEIVIGAHDTQKDVELLLADLCVPLLLKTMQEYAQGRIVPRIQDEARATNCKKLHRDDGRIHWEMKSHEIYNQYRAYTPWPGVWTVLHGKRLKILRMRPAQEVTKKAGMIDYVNGKLYIGTGSVAVEITDLQMEGKNKMTANEFINGYAGYKETVLESPHTLETS